MGSGEATDPDRDIGSATDQGPGTAPLRSRNLQELGTGGGPDHLPHAPCPVVKLYEDSLSPSELEPHPST